MKKILIVFMIVISSMLTAACSKVPAGNVGVKVYLLGGAKGVDNEVVGTGRYWIGMNEELYLFPTFSQNYVWTKDSQNGSPTDESISFQTSEGMVVNADVGITYNIEPDKVAVVFQKYRKGIDEITDVFLRNMVRDALVEKAGSLKVEDVYGNGKGVLMDSVEEHVRDQVKEIGINVEKVYWLGELRLPPAVTTALNAKIQATQMAEQRKNEVAQAKAEAEKEREKAKGEADAQLIRAKAEAEAITLRAEAIRNSKDVIALNAIEKWDGKLPVYMGDGPVPFLQISK